MIIDHRHQFFTCDADNVQHVAVSEEVARVVETHSQRLFLRRFLELNDGALHLTFADTKRSHSVDIRRHFSASQLSPFTPADNNIVPMIPRSTQPSTLRGTVK